MQKRAAHQSKKEKRREREKKKVREKKEREKEREQERGQKEGSENSGVTEQEDSSHQQKKNLCPQQEWFVGLSQPLGPFFLPALFCRISGSPDSPGLES